MWNNTRKNSDILSLFHTLQIKRHKTVNDDSKKFIENFKLTVVGTSPKLTDKKETIVTSFGASYQDQGIEMTSEIILTHILSHWNKYKSS